MIFTLLFMCPESLSSSQLSFFTLWGMEPAGQATLRGGLGEREGIGTVGGAGAIFCLLALCAGTWLLVTRFDPTWLILELEFLDIIPVNEWMQIAYNQNYYDDQNIKLCMFMKRASCIFLIIYIISK